MNSQENFSDVPTPAPADVPKEEKAPPERPLPIYLASKFQLNQKILQEDKILRIMEPVKDSSGAVLVQNYDKLAKAYWQKYRTNPDCRELHFVTEIPLILIEGINTSLLLPEDLQFLGIYHHLKGADGPAEQFFNEALRSGGVDAYINIGVFRYRRGERGVMDNFMLSKKHFMKAVSLMDSSGLPEDEKRIRQKVCADAIDEIDYRLASFWEKLVRLVIRFLMFKFETVVPYVGAAGKVPNPEEQFRVVLDSLFKIEFEMKKKAYSNFISTLHTKIPEDQPQITEELQEIQKEYRNITTTAVLNVAVSRLGEFYTDNARLFEKKDDAPEPETAAAAPAPEDPDKELSVEVLIDQLASHDEIERVSARHKLISVGEMLGMAAKSTIEPEYVAWMLRDKMDQAEVMAKLFSNPSVSTAIKKLIQQRHPNAL